MTNSTFGRNKFKKTKRYVWVMIWGGKLFCSSCQRYTMIIRTWVLIIIIYHKIKWIKIYRWTLILTLKPFSRVRRRANYLRLEVFQLEAGNSKMRINKLFTHLSGKRRHQVMFQVVLIRIPSIYLSLASTTNLVTLKTSSENSQNWKKKLQRNNWFYAKIS